jgi:hypothetical protein
VLNLDRADVLVPGTDVVLFASAIMLAAAVAAPRVLGDHGRPGLAPAAPVAVAKTGEYSPV